MKINYPLLALAIGAFGIGTTEFSPMGLLPVIARRCGCLDSRCRNVNQCLCSWRNGGRAADDASTFSSCPPQCVDFPDGNFHARQRTFRHRAGLYDPDAFTHFDQPESRSIFWFGFSRGRKRGAKHKQSQRSCHYVYGLTLANIGGVPAATWLGETIGWRMSFLATAGLGVISMVSLFFSLPKGGAGARPEVKKELAVLMRPQVLSALLTTVLGAGAMFTLYTYISPVLQSITHATPVFVTAMLVLIGVGFSIGNYLGGKLADRSVNGTLKGFLLLLMVIMLAIPFLARNEFGAAISMVVWGAATLRSYRRYRCA